MYFYHDVIYPIAVIVFFFILVNASLLTTTTLSHDCGVEVFSDLFLLFVVSSMFPDTVSTTVLKYFSSLCNNIQFCFTCYAGVLIGISSDKRTVLKIISIKRRNIFML